MGKGWCVCLKSGQDSEPFENVLRTEGQNETGVLSTVKIIPVLRSIHLLLQLSTFILLFLDSTTSQRALFVFGGGSKDEV